MIYEQGMIFQDKEYYFKFAREKVLYFKNSMVDFFQMFIGVYFL